MRILAITPTQNMTSSSPSPSITLRDAWQIIKPYWVSEDRLKGRLLLATIVGLALAQVYLSVLFNNWNAEFYNSLQDKNLPEFMHQLVIFCLLAAIFIGVAVYRQYFNQMLTIRWRKWMTQQFQTLWLSNHTYYRLQALYKNTDNPDQRIAEDIDGFTTGTLSLAIGLMSSVVTLFSFLTILWGLSGALEFHLGTTPVHIPGYMVWVAIVYAVFGTYLTHRIGASLVSLNFNQQRFEANFRYSMVRLRENAENIAFYKGEHVEKKLLTDRFQRILENWWQIMKKQKQLTWFTSAYGQIAIIFPIVVAAPRYFSGAIQLGGLMQTASAFGHVQGALSWLIDVYPQFANWKATASRLDSFLRAMRTQGPETTPQAIHHTHAGTQQLSISDLDITLPDGQALLRHFSLTLQSGERLLLTGPSGSGKTTLLRAIAGLWPYGSGTITLPVGASIAFVPQKPYLPLLSIRDIVCYPHPSDQFDETRIKESLTAVGLEGLIPYLDTTDSWSQNLSLGEQQKLAFARLWLQRPDVVLLDEASSALDEASERNLYQLLIATLPHAILVSVGHRSTLKAFHTREQSLRSE